MVIFGYCSSGNIHHVFMRQSLSGSWDPRVRLGWPASKHQGIRLSLPPSARITSISYCAWPFTGVRRLNLGPHAGIVSTSLMQPFLCPCSWLLKACGDPVWRTCTASWEPTLGAQGCVADREFLQEFLEQPVGPCLSPPWFSRAVTSRWCDRPCLCLCFLS